MLSKGIIGSNINVLRTLRNILHKTRNRSFQDINNNNNTLFYNELFNYTLSQYRKKQFLNNDKDIQLLRSLADDYVSLLDGIEEQKRLWSLDTGMEKKLNSQEMIKMSARRVGLQVPDIYENQA